MASKMAPKPASKTGSKTAKSVLGNDPFRRGAAAREKPEAKGEVDAELTAAPAVTEVGDQAGAKAGAKPGSKKKAATTAKKQKKKPALKTRRATPEPLAADPDFDDDAHDRSAAELLEDETPVTEPPAAPAATDDTQGEYDEDDAHDRSAAELDDDLPSAPQPDQAHDEARDDDDFDDDLPSAPQPDQALDEAPDDDDFDDDAHDRSAAELLDEPAAATDEPHITSEHAPRPARPEDRLDAPDAPTARERAAAAFSLAREVAGNALRTGSLSRAAKVADGVLTALLTGLGASGSEEVDAYGKDAKLARKLTPVSDFFYDRYWRVTVEGASHLPRGPSILVANHSGAIPVDGFILHEALRRERPDLPEARWLAEDQIFHAPFLGTLYNRLGAIRASPENAARLLAEGRPVITFPEGVHGIRKSFQERYQLKRLGRGGFAKLALSQQVPIVPVAIVGAEESMPLLGKLPGAALGLPYLPVTVPPLPARWLIRFGEPLSVDGFAKSTSDDPATVQKFVERTRESIEGMLKALLHERGSVF